MRTSIVPAHTAQRLQNQVGIVSGLSIGTATGSVVSAPHCSRHNYDEVNWAPLPYRCVHIRRFVEPFHICNYRNDRLFPRPGQQGGGLDPVGDAHWTAQREEAGCAGHRKDNAADSVPAGIASNRWRSSPADWQVEGCAPFP